MKRGTKLQILATYLFILSVPTFIQAQDNLQANHLSVQTSAGNLLTKPSTGLVSSPTGRPPDPSPVSIHEKFATFIADDDFNSVLLLENFRPDLPITFKPVLILAKGEISLDDVTVPAHSSTTVDINAALKERGLVDTRGTVAIRFSFTSYGPGGAVIQIRDDRHHVFLNSYAQSPEEYWSGTTYDAVVWTPHDGTEGFVAITNTSMEVHSVRVAFLARGRSEQRLEVQVPARQTRRISLDDLLARSRKSGGGIHIEYDQGADELYTGAIVVEGQLFNKKNGFAKNIHFMDKALPPTGILRTHFLMLGRQPAEDNFPADISFRSVAAVRNIDTVSVQITPTVKFLRSDGVQAIPLPNRSLAPAESLLIDFSEEQKAGHLPQDFTQGSLELTPDTGRASIVGELFNFGPSGGYVVGPSFTSYPTRSTSSIWRTDGTLQTTLMVENAAAENDSITLHLYSERNQYSKTFQVPAGKLMKINVRDLQQNGVPDDNGSLLLDTSGVMSLVGHHSTHSKLSYDKIIHSTGQADYVGLPPSACDFVTNIARWIDFSPANQPFPVMKTYYWTQSGPQDESQAGSASSNTNLAQISNNGSGDMVTFSPPDDGATHSVNIGPGAPQELVQFCDACSWGDVNVLATAVSGIRLADTFWKNPTASTQGCFYASLACIPPTQPTCKSQSGVMFSPTGSCPSFLHSQTLAIGSSCFGQSVDNAASGPGACN